MKKVGLKKYAVVTIVVIGLTAALTGVASAEMTGEVVTASQLEVRFGDNGAVLTMTLENNDTAAAIKEHVGTADWRLPICHFDDYNNWEVMQYYDISSRYEIPSVDMKIVASQKAGEVYHSHPNRTILFYGSGEVTGDYTRVGEVEVADDLKKAVVNNPILQGWGNRIVQIKSVK